MKQLIFLFFFLISSISLMAQDVAQPAVEMATGLRSSGKIYVVVITLLIIFSGLAFYIIRIDKRLGKLEKESK